MLTLLLGIFTRIFSNSYLNVFQKLLTQNGESSSVVNFYTYLGLSVISITVFPSIICNSEIIFYALIMGIMGAIGNYYIIKALSCGELSVLAPINSYKPVVALIFGMFILGEMPGLKEIIGIMFIILGTFIIFNNKSSCSKALLYRFLALIFSGTEALFIKKVILLSDINSAFFYWAVMGLIFSFIIAFSHKLKIKKCNIKTQLLLIVTVAVMQYSTNYVFSKMNVSYALALFQLSTLISIFLGVNIFKEKDLLSKIKATVIMIIGAVLIILG